MTQTILCSMLALVVAGAAAAQTLQLDYDDDGMVTVNGERTFIIGTYYVTSKYAPDKPYADAAKESAETGYNLIRAGSREELDAIQQADAMGWVSVGAVELDKLEESSQALRERVTALADHPALAVIETVDEPAWTWKSPEQRVPAEVFALSYPIIKEAAPGRLLYMNHAPTNLVKTMRAYNAGTDIVAMDIYPVNPGGLREQYALFEDGHQGDLLNTYISQVGDYVDKMRQVTGPDRPLLMVLQAFAWEMLRDEAERDEAKVLYPLYDESRFMAFQSVIKGANGVVYWGSHFTPPDSQCIADLNKVVGQLAELEPVLAERAHDLPLETDYIEMGRSVDAGIQWLAKMHDGQLYLFTCNADKNLHKATLRGLGEWTSCEVLHEDRTVAVENGAITEEWPPFSVHVYRFGK